MFSRYTSGSKMNQLVLLKLWHLLKYAELINVVRQREQMFVNVLNKFASVLMMKILRSFWRQCLYSSLTKSTHIVHCICIHKIHQQYWEITWWILFNRSQWKKIQITETVGIQFPCFEQYRIKNKQIQEAWKSLFSRRLVLKLC